MEWVLNCGGKVLNLSQAVVMGIINLTPDSFFPESRHKGIEKCLVKTNSMVEEGASIIDFGAYSSRPGADDISCDEELTRLVPVIEAISKEFPDVILSVDTFRAKVAEEAIYHGAGMINDISAGQFDPEILTVIAKHKIAYVLMHTKGRPGEMQQNAEYQNLLMDLLNFMSQRLKVMMSNGIGDIIIDPGFGFAKTRKHNFKILKDLHCFKIFDRPILAGISRKSMIYKTLNISIEKALNGTTALHMKALIEGASILRAHDVKEAVETIALFSEFGTILESGVIGYKSNERSDYCMAIA